MDFILYLYSFPTVYKEEIGFITLIVSAVGAYIMLRMQKIIHNSSHPIAINMSKMYFWDAIKFCITACFGIAGLLIAPQWAWSLLYFIRPFILVALVYSAYKLYKSYIDVIHSVEQDK